MLFSLSCLDFLYNHAGQMGSGGWLTLHFLDIIKEQTCFLSSSHLFSNNSALGASAWDVPP